MAARRRGCLKRRGSDSWLISFFMHFDHNGKRRDFTQTVRGTRKEAEQRLQKKLLEHDQGTLSANPNLTLNEFFAEWLESFDKVRNSLRTWTGDEMIYNRHFRDTIGNKKIDKIQPLDIQRIYGAMSQRGLAPQTIKHVHALIRKVLNRAVRLNVLQRNPALLVDTPKVPRIERRTLDAEEARRFIAACGSIPQGLIFEFALLTGMRPEEFLAVKWGDLDIERKTVRVVRALVRLKGSFSFNEPKTSRSRRTIILPEPLVHKLVIHKQKQWFQRQKALNLWEDNDLIFCSEFGTPLAIPNITYRYFRPLLVQAGLPRIRLYDLRHSHATLLLTAEEHPKVVAERLGHSTIVLTLDTYSHVLPTIQKRATDKLEKMLFG